MYWYNHDKERFHGLECRVWGPEFGVEGLGLTLTPTNLPF